MRVRYITAEQADALRKRITWFDPRQVTNPPGIRPVGVLGVVTTDYYIVKDGDPRLQGQAPDPLLGA